VTTIEQELYVACSFSLDGAVAFGDVFYPMRVNPDALSPPLSKAEVVMLKDNLLSEIHRLAPGAKNLILTNWTWLRAE
jgi:hypothetical protein